MLPTGNCRSHRVGLTLIEILISVVILAFASVLILQALAKGAYTLNVAKNRMRAYAFACAKMADLELSFKQGARPAPTGEFRVGRDRFQWRVETSKLPERPPLERVTLTVQWHQGRKAYESQVSTFERVAEDQPS